MVFNPQLAQAELEIFGHFETLAVFLAAAGNDEYKEILVFFEIGHLINLPPKDQVLFLPCQDVVLF